MSDDRLLRTRQAAECLGLSLKRFAMFARRLPHSSLANGRGTTGRATSTGWRCSYKSNLRTAGGGGAITQGRMPTSGDFWRE